MSSFDEADGVSDTINNKSPDGVVGFIKKRKAMIVTVCITLIIALLVAFTLMIINGISSNIEDDEQDEPSNKVTEKDKTTYSTNNFEYKVKLTKEVKDALNTRSKDYLMLVNKSNPLGETYIPENLVSLSSDICTKESQLDKVAAIAAEALIAEMMAEGFTDIRITSAYRSYYRQDQLFEGYVNDEMSKNSSLSREEAENIVLGYSAAAGYSEHQSGLCVDLINVMKMVGLYNYGTETPANQYDVGFAELDEFKWLQENAHKFGFILRYPESKENVTKYDYESWHYRFVGVDVATKIYKEGITLEEYLKK